LSDPASYGYSVIVAVPGDTGVLPPTASWYMVPAVMPVLISLDNIVTPPVSAMSSIPGEATDPLSHIFPEVLCAVPISLEKWGLLGKSVG